MSYTKVSPPVSPLATPPRSPLGSPPGSPLTAGVGQPFTPNPRLQDRHSARSKRYKYLRRIFKFKQMDFEYAFWQMLYLFISPQKVYRNFHYRKQTKDQWARDDPAFLVLLSFWLLLSSVFFAFVLHLDMLSFLKFILWVIFVDTIGVGLVLASIAWFLANRYMLVKPNHGQDVEWGYCFDVHLNAFFPLLMILHFFQLPFLHAIIMGSRGFLNILFGNTFWLVAIGYYIYLTFVGYSSLPYLKFPLIEKSHWLALQFVLLLVFYLISVSFSWNLTDKLCRFYRDRVW